MIDRLPPPPIGADHNAQPFQEWYARVFRVVNQIGSGEVINALSAGTQSVSTGTVVFSNSNGISFGMSGSSRITASYTVPSTAGLLSNINVSAGTTSNNLSAITFNNGGNVSFGLNGSVVTASAPAGGGMAISAGTESVSTGTLVFSNSNGITFGMSGSSRITASHNALTTARASNDGVGLNTAQTNVTWTVNSSGISINASGYAGTGTTFAGANISGSMTMNSAGLNLSMSVAAPGAAAENNWLNLLGNNTAGNTTVSGSTLGLSGIGMVLSGTNNSQLVLSVRDATWQDWDNMKVIQSMNQISNITATAFSRGRPLLFPIEMDGHLVWNKAMIEMSRSTSGSNAFTVGFGIYSFVNSTQISLMGSLTNAFSATNTASISGVRRFELSGIGTGASSLTPGHYIGALMFSANGDNTDSMNYSLRGGLTANPPVGLIRPGSDSNVTANLSSIALRHFRGFWSTTTANPPDTIGLTQVSMWTTGAHPYFWMGSN